MTLNNSESSANNINKILIVFLITFFLFLVLAQWASATISDENLISCYDFEEASGATIDYAGYLNGTTANSIGYQSTGINGYGYSFANANAKVTFATTGDYNFLKNESEGYTIAAWLYAVPEASLWEHIIKIYESPTSYFRFANIPVVTSVYHPFQYGSNQFNPTSALIPLNSWSSAVWIFDDDNFLEYINGVLTLNVTNANISHAFPNADAILGVENVETVGWDWDGNMDTFAFFDRAWTKEEVDSYYNSGTGVACSEFQPPATPICDAWNITCFEETANNFSIVTYETGIYGLKFNNDGSKMYTAGVGSDSVNQFNLTTNYDITTAVFDYIFNESVRDNQPAGILFNNDGSQFYISGNENDRIYTYVLTTNYDLSTATYVEYKSIPDTKIGFKFNADGTYAYFSDFTNVDILQYYLSPAYNFSSATLAETLDISTHTTNSFDIEFGNNGEYLYVVGRVEEIILQYVLSTPYNISTATYLQNLSVSTEAIAFKPDGLSVYLGNSAIDYITEYSSPSPQLNFYSRNPTDGSKFTSNTTPYTENFEYRLSNIPDTDSVNCSLFEDGVLVNSELLVPANFTNNTGIFNISRTFMFNINSTTFEYSMNCTTTSDVNITDTAKDINVLIDGTNPTIVLFYPDILTMTQTFTNMTTVWQIWDDNNYLAELNVTNSSGGNVFTKSYNTTGNIIYNITEIINNTYADTYTITLDAYDGHTKNKIKDIKNSIVNKEIKFKDVEDIIIKSKSKKDFSKVKTTKKNDRYNFEYEREESEKKNYKGYDDFIVESTGYIDIIQDSKYSGHMIIQDGTPDNWKWIDFETSQKFKVDLTRVSPNIVDVRVYGNKDVDYIFESIGILNHNNLSVSYYYNGNNVTFRANNSALAPINTFNITLSTGETFGTTTGEIVKYWLDTPLSTNTTFTITTFADDYTTNVSQLIKDINSSIIYNPILYDFNSIYISIYNATDLALLTQNVTLTIVANDSSFINITDAGTITVPYLEAGDYELRFVSDGFASSSKYVTITNDSTQTMSVYLQENTSTEIQVIEVYDTTSDAVEGAVVWLQKQIVNDTSLYYTVQEAQTNSDGQTSVYVIRDTSVFYRFAVIVDGTAVPIEPNGNYFTTATIFIPGVDETIRLIVNLQGATPDYISDRIALVTNLSLSDDNVTANFTWINGGNSVTGGKLVLYGKYLNSSLNYEYISEVNATGSSGNLEIVIPEVNNTIFNVRAYVTLNAAEVLVDELFKTWEITEIIDKYMGIFLAAIILIFSAFATIKLGALASSSISIGVLVVLSIAGFIMIPVSVVTGFLALAVIVFFKTRTT